MKLTTLYTSRGLHLNLFAGVGLFVLMLTLFGFTILTSVEIFFWLFFLAMFVWNIDGRVSIAGALVFLILIPILLSLYRYAGWQSGEAWAEAVAVWVFYFLTIGVIKQIWELVWEGKETTHEIKKVSSNSIVDVPRYDNAKKKSSPDTTISPLNKPRKVDYVRKI